MKRYTVRYVIIVLLILLQTFTVVAILATTQRNTEDVLQTYTEDVLGHVADTVVDKTLRFLAPAEQAASLTASLIETGSLEPSDSILEAYFLSQLATNPQLTGIYLGRYDGSFIRVSRTDDTYQSKFVRISGERSVEYIYRDATFTKTASSFDPQDDYDPRQRLWFADAVRTSDLIWTDPYVFFTSKYPGITAAKAAGAAGVVGVDIEISGLTNFLDDIPVGKHGSAFIQDSAGQLVAYPGMTDSLAKNNDRLFKVDDLNDPSATALQLSRSRTDAVWDTGAQTFLVAGAQFYGLTVPFPIGNKVWWMAVYAPASDFTGAVASRYERSLIEITMIGLLACLLAIPFVFKLTQPFAALVRRATTDSLTGLINREEFLQRSDKHLERSRQRAVPMALAMLDLDRFKPVNDHYGHAVGNEVLQVVAERLLAAVREGDLVARIGGDEFAVLFNDVPATDVLAAAERIRQGLVTEPIRSSAGEHRLGATLGVVSVTPDTRTLDALEQADAVLIAGKMLDKNKTYIANPMPVAAAATEPGVSLQVVADEHLPARPKTDLN